MVSVFVGKVVGLIFSTVVFLGLVGVALVTVGLSLKPIIGITWWGEETKCVTINGYEVCGYVYAFVEPYGSYGYVKGEAWINPSHWICLKCVFYFYEYYPQDYLYGVMWEVNWGDAGPLDKYVEASAVGADRIEVAEIYSLVKAGYSDPDYCRGLPQWHADLIVDTWASCDNC